MRIVRIEEDFALALIQIGSMFRTGGLKNAVRVIQHHAKIADPPDARFRAHRRLAGLNAWITENALLRFTALPVKVDFFVRAAADAQPPAAAFVLVDQHDAVFFTLIDRAARAGRHATGVQAVLAQARQIHHKSVFELAVHFGLHGFEVFIRLALAEFATQQFFPVRAPDDFFHAFTGQQRARAGGRNMFAFRRVMQMLVIKAERFVIIVNGR